MRFVTKDDQTALSYAKKDRFAIVLCFNQALAPAKIEQTRQWVRKVIDDLIAHDGTFYLPYQHFATVEQFKKCYPQWQEIAVKNSKTPFTNGLYQDYLRIS